MGSNSHDKPIDACVMCETGEVDGDNPCPLMQEARFSAPVAFEAGVRETNRGARRFEIDFNGIRALGPEIPDLKETVEICPELEE